MKYGNFGDYQSVGDGVFELRLHFGAGYRIYFGPMNLMNAALLQTNTALRKLRPTEDIT